MLPVETTQSDEILNIFALTNFSFRDKRSFSLKGDPVNELTLP